MNYKIKILIICLAIVVLAMVSFFYIKSIGSRKAKIQVSEEQNQQIEEKNSEPIGGTTSLDQSDQKRSDLETPASEKSAEPVGDSVSDAQKETSRLSLGNSPVKITDRLVNFGFQSATNRSIDTIIIHSTYDAIGSDPFNVAGVIAEYTSYGVSPHYLIGRDGSIYRLVEDKNIAYHAGVAQTPDGRTNVNDFSIGIELINTKTDKVTDAQYAALNDLIVQLKSEYKIRYVLGHDQIAPGRKTDPWNLDWSRLK